MKKLLMSVVFSAVCALGADVTGNWSGTLEATRSDGSTNTDTAQFKLKQEGTSVTGMGGGPNDSFEIRNGKVDGDSLTFEVVASENRTFKVALKVDGDSASGTASREREGQTQTAKLFLKREK
jgi:hypothetical protein